MPSFSFPQLKNQDIVIFINELGGNLDEKHLLNPTSEVIWPLYEAVAQRLLGISREELSQPAFNVLSKLEYPELHEESVVCYASWHTIRQLMLAAGVSDFSFRDLTKPDSRRTIRNLSGLINYAKFRSEREQKLSDLQDECLLDTKLQLEEEIEETKREIASIEADRKAQIPAVQALESETNELWLQMSALNKKQNAAQSDIRALKQELSSITDAIAGQKYMLQQAKQEESELRGQIVQSPEKLEKTLEEKKTILDKTEAATEEARKSLHHWQQKLESYTKAEKKVSKYLTRVEEIQKLMTRQKAATKEVKTLKTKIKADEEEGRQRDIKLADLTLKGQHLQELIDNDERLIQTTTEEEERALEEARSRYSQLIKRQQDADIPQKEAQVQYLLSQIEEVVRTKDEAIRNCRKEIAGIQQQVLKYYTALLSCAGPIPQLSG